MNARSQAPLLVLFAAALTAFAIWLVLPAAPAGFYWDDAWYLWMSEWFSADLEHRQVAYLMLQNRQYPPLFPYLLSMTGTGIGEIAPGLVMNALLAGLACALFSWWLMARGMGILPALMAGLILMVNPMALMFLPALMSEPLFLLLSIAALVLASRAGQNSKSWLLIGFLTGLAIATRSVGWALALAFAIQLLMGRREFIPQFVATLALTLVMTVLMKAGLPEARSYFEDYKATLTGLDPEFISSQVAAISRGWFDLWGSVTGGMLVLVPVLPGLWLGLKRFTASSWYILVSLGMLVAWPYPDHMARFIWVLMPALLVCAVDGFEWLGTRTRVPHLQTGVIALVLLAGIPSGLWRTTDRILETPGVEMAQLSRMAVWTRDADPEAARLGLAVRKQMLEDMGRINAATGDQMCVYSELAAVVSAQTGRLAYASAWHSLDDFRSTRFQCPWYYMVPDALGLSADDIQVIRDSGAELFSSTAPYDESGETTLGVFMDLRPPEEESVTE